MKFGSVAVADAVGAIAAHSVRVGDVVVKKGAVLTQALAAALADAGLVEIVVARLEPGDIGEDEAAARLAVVVAGSHVRVDRAFTGRCNLFAEQPGVLVLDQAAILSVNDVDEAITLATLPAFASVTAGTMVGTVKIIPYAVPQRLLARACEGATGAVRIAPYRRRGAGYIATRTAALKPSVVAKTRTVTQQRLAAIGADMVAEDDVPHDLAMLAEALARQAARDDTEFLIVFGATAIADRRDVVPAAIEAAGGDVRHLGLPVDPGNLLLIGSIAGKPVIGAPGCARSPKENGFDWVLRRVVADIPVTRADIVAMGMGGLLMEIGTRPQPRLGGNEGDRDDGGGSPA